MIAGRMDREIVIQRKTVTPDGNGAPIENWTTIFTGFAQFKPMTGREYLAGITDERIISAEVAQFFTHYIDGLTTADRIVFQNKNWNVTALREIGRREGLEFVAQVVR